MNRFPVKLRLPSMLAPLAGLVFVLALSGAAEQPRVLSYRGGGQGKVVFDHQVHAKAFTCNDCHKTFSGTGTQLFETHKRGLIDMDDHGRNSKCFACHNGKTAFDDCAQCHRK